jgi:hypothetical protein
MCCGASSTSGVAPLDDHAAVHDDDLLAQLAHNRKVMTDQDVRHAGGAADGGQQVEHLRLDRYVQRGDRFVEDDEPRLGGEHARDRHPLALSAGERTRERAPLAGSRPTISDRWSSRGRRDSAAPPRYSFSAVRCADGHQ